MTGGRRPLQGARVYLWGKPCDQVYEHYTDELGRYELDDVPVAFARYVMRMEKDDYKTKPAGDVEVSASETTTTD